MDRTGDGADSAEDSGSSQPYNSTLPGIPKVKCNYLLILFFIFWRSCSFYTLRLFIDCMWYILPTYQLGYCRILLTIVISFHSGKCQTIISAFAGANGRGYPQMSFWKDHNDWAEAPFSEEAGILYFMQALNWLFLCILDFWLLNMINYGSLDHLFIHFALFWLPVASSDGLHYGLGFCFCFYFSENFHIKVFFPSNWLKNIFKFLSYKLSVSSILVAIFF